MNVRVGFLALVAVSAAACGGDGTDAPATKVREKPPLPMAMDECGLYTGYPGDEMCILPPPPDKGFQVHVGPSDYLNPEPVIGTGASRAAGAASSI